MTISLVTGGNRGIGYFIVKGLATRLTSPTVIIACRDVEAGRKAIAQLQSEGVPADALDVVQMDIEDDDSITAAVEQVKQKYGKLDVLVNNAARVTKVESDNLKEIRASSAAMYNNGITSQEVVTRAFLPLLRKASSPRVLMVSSSLGSLQKTSDREYTHVDVPNYAASKAALNMLTLYMQVAEDKLPEGETRVAFWTVNPGYCKTAFNAYHGHKDPADGAEPIVRLAEGKDGQYKPGTFWQYEEGVFGQLPW